MRVGGINYAVRTANIEYVSYSNKVLLGLQMEGGL
jgi:hypothetical protein